MIMKNFLHTVLVSICLIIVSACTEKDDFILEPTPTSVIISGTVTTTSGKPLANIPIYIDYNKSYWLGSQTTLHKAKTKTDSNGRYKLFFEPEKKSDPSAGASESYNLFADLNGLSSSEFLKPSDFDESMNSLYMCTIYRELAQSENIEINLHFPKKKEVKAECRNFLADNRLRIRNEIEFGANYESLNRMVDLDSDGNGSTIIPCAEDGINTITIISDQNILEEIETKEFVFANNHDTSILFDNNNILQNCSFKLSLYDCFSFDGDPHENPDTYTTPAPFDFLGFRILLPDGQYEEFGTQRYQYYDSITWSSPAFPETFKVYEKKRNGSTLTEHLVTQWGSYFFDSGFHKTILKGYKNGRVICSDSVSFELKDRDFLCFDWSNCKTIPKQDGVQTIYCQLNSYFEYNITTPIEIDGTKSVDIYVKFRDNWSDDIILNWQEARLSQLLWTHLGQRVEYDKSNIKNIFKLLSPEDIPGKLYENETTRAIVMHRLPDEDRTNKEFFYIHVESK